MNSALEQKPGRCGGRPTFKGTRIAVDLFIDYLEHDSTIDEFLSNYFDQISEETLKTYLRHPLTSSKP